MDKKKLIYEYVRSNPFCPFLCIFIYTQSVQGTKTSKLVEELVAEGLLVSSHKDNKTVYNVL